VRQLEFDVWDDPQGGHWLHPFAPGGKRYARPPWASPQIAEMGQPGFKVMQSTNVDFRSSCATLLDCLTAVHSWSVAHRQHIPILLLIHARDDAFHADPLPTPRFDETAFDRLDATIRSVFAANALITPDEVQGSFATLRDAVRADRWPTLEHARGRVYFVLDDAADKVAVYRGARKSLEGRAMFVSTDEKSPAASYVTLDDPILDAKRINAAVDAGMIVRTRADADTVEARDDDHVRRDAALISGSQFISTDYIEPNPRFSLYEVHLEAGLVARCNPRRASMKCAGAAVE
jgi:Phosphoinositide phospholipase C, Ca2+-dependent